MIYVVGSGPAGVSCAYALVHKGIEVTMLDAGIELEPEARAVVNKMQNSKHWDDSMLRKIKERMQASIEKKIVKYIYGSDYPYREVDSHISVKSNGVSCLPSFGKGGLSAVWGAAVMPYLGDEIGDWPISIKDLAPHYSAVLKFMRIAASKDGLSELFPLYTENYQAFRHSRQASLLLKDLNKYKGQLNAEGFVFGSSRLAVQFDSYKKKPGCIYCGLCLYGCPYGLIYNSAFTLDELKKNKNFHYIKDIVVKEITESKDGVRVIAQHRLNGKEIIYNGSRVFLGCNVIPTAKIILESMKAYDKEIIVKDSQLFILPFLRYKGVSDVTQEKLHTLSQIFMEIFDKKLDQRSIHVQFFTHNDLYEAILKRKFGLFYSSFKKPLEAFMSRIIRAQVYIHSDSSPSISMKLKKGSPSRLILDKKANRHANKLIKSIIKKFYNNKKYFRMVPFTPLLEILKPGGSNHYGGSFPMRKNPKKFESDVLGRPYGFKRTHIVDASVFPSIPTQTIAFTVMANAHRIGSTYNAKT